MRSASRTPRSVNAIQRTRVLKTLSEQAGVGSGRRIQLRDVYPVKYYKDEGFIDRTIEIDEDDLERIIEEYLRRHADFDFDEIEVVNNRPMNIWLYAKCRRYINGDFSQGTADRGSRSPSIGQVRWQSYRLLRKCIQEDIAPGRCGRASCPVGCRNC
jgi:hypothetical protein